MARPHETDMHTLNEQALQRLLLQASARETEQVLWAYRAYIADLLLRGEEYARHLRFLIRCFEGVHRECVVMAGSLQWRLGERLINRVKKVMRRSRNASVNLVKLTALGGAVPGLEKRLCRAGGGCVYAGMPQIRCAGRGGQCYR